MSEVPWEDMAVIDGTQLVRTITVWNHDADPPTISDLTGTSLRFRVFEVEEPEVFGKALTVSSPTSGEGFLVVVPVEYAALIPGTPYLYDIRLTDTAGGVSTIVQGGFSRIAD